MKSCDYGVLQPSDQGVIPLVQSRGVTVAVRIWCFYHSEQPSTIKEKKAAIAKRLVTFWPSCNAKTHHHCKLNCHSDLAGDLTLNYLETQT